MSLSTKTRSIILPVVALSHSRIVAALPALHCVRSCSRVELLSYTWLSSRLVVLLGFPCTVVSEILPVFRCISFA